MLLGSYAVSRGRAPVSLILIIGRNGEKVSGMLAADGREERTAIHRPAESEINAFTPGSIRRFGDVTLPGRQGILQFSQALFIGISHSSVLRAQRTHDHQKRAHDNHHCA